MKRRKRKRSRVRPQHLIYGGVATGAALVILWMLFAGPSGRSPTGAGRNAAPDASDASPPNTAVLFYVAQDGTALVQHEREVPLGENTLARARIIAEQQLAAPETPLISPFPEGTRLRAIYLTAGGDAFVDLTPEVTLSHPGGSLDELFTVYALVNALTSNLPEVSAVQILIEGQEVDTLAGHVDLRRPLGPNMKWVSQADPASGAERSPAES